MFFIKTSKNNKNRIPFVVTTNSLLRKLAAQRRKHEVCSKLRLKLQNDKCESEIILLHLMGTTCKTTWPRGIYFFTTAVISMPNRSMG